MPAFSLFSRNIAGSTAAQVRPAAGASLSAAGTGQTRPGHMADFGNRQRRGLLRFRAGTARRCPSTFRVFSAYSSPVPGNVGLRQRWLALCRGQAVRNTSYAKLAVAGNTKGHTNPVEFKQCLILPSPMNSAANQRVSGSQTHRVPHLYRRSAGDRAHFDWSEGFDRVSVPA